MTRTWRWHFPLFLFGCLGCLTAHAQIDPVRRDLFQLGYNAALQGHPPLSAYLFYYRNQPEFIREDWTLRLALAPTYLDTELGIAHALGENTDLGIGLAGGGFADSYYEVRKGTYRPEESFVGHGGDLSGSVYHLFNPGQEIPLYGVLRTTAHFATYDQDTDTAHDFRLPQDHGTFNLRSGLRWGGQEPLLLPDLAMAVSVWYDGQYRTGSGTYGFNDRELKSASHLFWAQGLIDYTLPEWKHNINLSLTLGTSIDADRFSAYRLGGLLPLASEFPLSLPGYYYQEISARNFGLLAGSYLLPLDKRQRWNLHFTGATALVDYLPGLAQPGNWHSGVGGGLLYKSSSWKVLVGYEHGFDAIRSHGRGADSVGFWVQLDLARAKTSLYNPGQPERWRGLQRLFNLFGS